MAIDYSNPRAPFAWWEPQRIRYNIGLIIAGISAFVLYCIAFEIFHDNIVAASENPSDVEITLFTTLIQGIFYLFMMGIANICYFLGAIFEKIFKPNDYEKYRRWAYNLGFWGSFALPFGIPLLVTIMYI